MKFQKPFLLFFIYVSLHELPAKTLELLHSSEAEYFTIGESDEGILILRGGIVLRLDEQILRAETVKINRTTGEIFGEGGVVLEKGDEKIQGDKFIYNQKNGTGIIYSVSGDLKGRYFHGGEIKFSDKKAYAIKDAVFTSCNLKNPHFVFEATKAYLTEENEFFALNVVLKVGKTPVFYFPAIFQTNFGTGIVTQYGNNISKGHFLQNTYFLSFNAENKTWLFPEKGELQFDWYQKGGIYSGISLQRQRLPLRYDLDLGVADYKQLDTVSDFGGTLVFTNMVRQADGSRREIHEFWWKVKTDIQANFRHSLKEDRQSNLVLRFEHYRHKNFMQEFGFRFTPTNTFDALFRNRFFQGRAGYENINWEASYSENFPNHSFAVDIKRQLRWFERTNNKDSKYLPVYDLQPRLSYQGNFSLVSPQGNFFGGLYSKLNLSGVIERYYADGQEIKTIYSFAGNKGIFSYFYFTPFFTYNPEIGYGLQQVVAKPNEIGLRTEALRQSFQFVYNRNTFRLGHPLLYHQTVHELSYYFNEGVRDPTFGHIRRHFWEGSLFADFFGYASSQVSISYDLRPYAYEIPNRFRWSDLIWRTSTEYDFVHGFTATTYGLKKRNYRHFASLGFVNTYSYLTRFGLPYYNNFSVVTKMGGYKIPLIKELMLIQIVFNWQENYLNLRQSQLHLEYKTELWLHPYWKLYLGGNSRAEQMERYRPHHPNYVPFSQDLINSVNFFEPAFRREAIFNLENFYADLEHDLHDWILRFSYTTRQRTVYYGPQLRNRLGFYEHTFFFSLTLKAFPGFGIPRTEIYRENPTDMPMN